MAILYIEEHKSCQHYLSKGTSMFRHCFLDKDTRFDIDTAGRYVFIFMLKGRTDVLCSHTQKKWGMTEGFMYSLEMGATYEGIGLSADTEFVLLAFEQARVQCDKFSMLSLRSHVPPKKDRIEQLSLLPQIKFFLDGMIFYIENEMYCQHLQDIKQSEWFFLMRAFFTKEQNATFFHSLIGGENTFETIVRENAEKATSVKELAELCYMTERTLHRKFKKHFNTSPKQWLMEQKKQEVHLELLQSSSDLKTLSFQLGFTSGSQLGSYCKKTFNKTPSEIRKEM